MNSLFKKLNFKDHPSILICNGPESFQPVLDDMLEFTEVHTDPKEVSAVSFAMAFVKTQAEIDQIVPAIAPLLEGDSILWMCYPKGSSKKYTCDFNRDTGWDILGHYDMEGVRQVAIDEDWSALRFRKVAYIKTMKRKFIPEHALEIRSEG